MLSHVAKDEARHYAFYRHVFELILDRDPNGALHSAAFILPAIDMPGVTMPGFKDLADVIRRAGIYGPRDYLRIVQEQIRFAEIMETRSRATTFSFEVVFNREFAME